MKIRGMLPFCPSPTGFRIFFYYFFFFKHSIQCKYMYFERSNIIHNVPKSS
ncbi:hypothetical protein Hanom_Chr15g01341111 [Helianthus anomalus]